MNNQTIKVEYNGVTYTRNPLSFQEMIAFGSRVTSKIVALLPVTGAIMTEKLNGDDNINSLYNTFAQVVAPEEIQDLIELFLNNETAGLFYINAKGKSVPLDEDNLLDHFENDFIAVITVAGLMAREVMGKFEPFTKLLNASGNKILVSLEEITRAVTSEITETAKDTSQLKPKKKSKNTRK